MANQITPNPSVPSQVVAEVKFPKFINNLGIIPTSYKDSMSYYECLAWLCKFLEEQVIPTVNENGEAVEELQALYVELNSYVTNYFDNLDVQEEINNKLDDMVEAGTLQEIIADYLNSKAVFGFNTVNDMKEATNLIDGSYAKTLGFNAVNDKGQALYQIREKTNEDVIDEITKIEIEDTDLIAVLINNGINHIMVFNEDLEVAIANSNILYLDNKTYNITLSQTIEKSNIKIYGNNATINSTSNIEYLFNLSNSYVEKVNFVENNISDKTKNFIMTGNYNRFYKCLFESTIGYKCNSITNVTFDECIFNNYYREINMGYGKLYNLKILNCKFTRNQNYELPYVGDRRILIYNYNGSNIALTNEVLENYGEFIEIKNCEFANGNNRQIHIFNVHNVEIENCIINESGLNSTQIGGSDDSVCLDFVKFFKVNNNYFGPSGENNFDILSSSCGEVKNNYFEKPYDYFAIDINWSDYVRTYGHSLEDSSILRSSDVIITNNTIPDGNTYIINITPCKNIHIFDNNITKLSSNNILVFQDFGSLTSANPSGLKVEALDVGRNNVKTPLGNYGTVGGLYQTHTYVIDVNSGHLSEDICATSTQNVEHNQQVFVTAYFPCTHGKAYKKTSLNTWRDITPSITTWNSTDSKSNRNGIDLVGNAYNTNSWNVVFNVGEYVDRVANSYVANLDSSYVYHQESAEGILFRVW